MHRRRTLVTHHAPDLDAIGAVWLFKRFDAQHYADARVLFVDPGQTLSEQEAQVKNIDCKQVTHVDTGLGEFDHHQPERKSREICATSLVHEHLCHIHPELTDDAALRELVGLITEIDHFGELFWPDAAHLRYSLMLPDILHGMESKEPHNDDEQLHFGMRALDAIYKQIEQKLKASESIAAKGQVIALPTGEALLIETGNDSVLRVAQMQGYVMAVRKDPDTGIVRIKLRPDASFDLKALSERVMAIDADASWFYHASGKMLLNGSKKQRAQKPSSLSLDTIAALIKEIYGRV